MKKEELKEKKLQPETKLTDEQLEQCNAGLNLMGQANDITSDVVGYRGCNALLEEAKKA